MQMTAGGHEADPGPEGRVRVGRYELLGLIGKGAFGRVLAAQDPVLNRMVAIKLITPDVPEEIRMELLERFRIEARLSGSLSHPNVVAVHDAGFESDMPFLVMELCEGPNLEEILQTHRAQGRRPTLAQAIWVIYHASCGIDHVHQAGVVHRDLKPGNIIYHRGDFKITDFGLARTSAMSHMTQAGQVMGTPAFMSPEQASGQSPDYRSDLYSLAAILFYILADRPPFLGDPLVLMTQLATKEAPRLSDVVDGYPQELDRILARALHRDPAERYPSGEAFCGDLLCVVPPEVVEAAGSLTNWVMPDETAASSKAKAVSHEETRGGALSLLPEYRPNPSPPDVPRSIACELVGRARRTEEASTHDETSSSGEVEYSSLGSEAFDSEDSVVEDEEDGYTLSGISLPYVRLEENIRNKVRMGLQRPLVRALVLVLAFIVGISCGWFVVRLVQEPSPGLSSRGPDGRNRSGITREPPHVAAKDVPATEVAAGEAEEKHDRVTGDLGSEKEGSGTPHDGSAVPGHNEGPGRLERSSEGGPETRSVASVGPGASGSGRAADPEGGRWVSEPDTALGRNSADPIAGGEAADVEQGRRPLASPEENPSQSSDKSMSRKSNSRPKDGRQGHGRSQWRAPRHKAAPRTPPPREIPWMNNTLLGSSRTRAGKVAHLPPVSPEEQVRIRIEDAWPGRNAATAIVQVRVEPVPRGATLSVRWKTKDGVWLNAYPQDYRNGRYDISLVGAEGIVLLELRVLDTKGRVLGKERFRVKMPENLRG